MKRLLVLFFVMSLPLLAAETGNIKGKVTDAQTGRPLAGARLLIKGAGHGATSNSKGKYRISKIPTGRYALQVSRSGYESKIIPGVKVGQSKTTTLNIQLKPLPPKSGAPSKTALPKNDVKKQTRIAKTRQTISHKKPGKPTAGSSISGAPKAAAPSPGKTLSKPTPGTPEPQKPVSPEPKRSSSKKVEPPQAKTRKSKPWSPDILKPAPANTVWPESDMITPPEKRSAYSRRVAQSGGLKAGFADDNQQFNYFLNFLKRYDRTVQAYPYDVSERIHFQLFDADNKSLPNVQIKVYDQTMDHVLDQGTSYADGSFYIFPAEFALQDQIFRLTYMVNGVYEIIDVFRDGSRKIQLKTDQPRPVFKQVPVDIVFILDTTGSMGEEINRLLETIDIIHLNLTNLPNQPLIRFGMVLYRDIEDQYRTMEIPLTADIDAFRLALEQVAAGGGGDIPEDLQAALESTLHDVNWNSNGLRLGFIITDAPPHLDYDQSYTYIDAALEARQQGIKLFTVGTGGLDIQGEYILRQIAQLTYAKYLFLTYGDEVGENTGGRTGSVSHHTGSNYQTDKLEAIIIRIAKEEISYFTDEPLDAGEDYFEVQPVDYETREETLAQLFKQAVARLVDYSTIKIDKVSQLGVLPIQAKTSNSVINAEYFSEQLLLSVAQNDQFTLIARKDLQQILEEQKLQLSGLLTDDETTQIGELLGAELLLSGELYEKDTGSVIFLKLLRVETAEILAVTKIVLDKGLGL